MNNITKKQHFVPQFYLRQFVDRDGFLHCYRKSDSKQFPAHTNDICFKEYGYEVKAPFGNSNFLLPNEIENMFGSLEGEYDLVLKNVVENCLLNSGGKALICSSYEKEILASMVANFIARNFLAVNDFVDGNITRDLLENNQEVKDIDNLLRELTLGDAKPFLELAQKIMFLNPSEEGVTKYIIDELLRMNATFFVSKEMNFVTSDCPVAYNCDADEIFMARLPLNSQVIVIYSKSDNAKKFRNRARLLDPRFVKKLNRDYIDWGVAQMVIAKSKDDIALLI